MISLRMQRVALICIVLLGLVLRLKGIDHPLLDHPGWRQGDEAAIARNFAEVDWNIFHPQADYNGPGPNYVELELQIVPWLAGMLYKAFGVHEIFGRLISVAASLGTVVVLFYFGRYLFLSSIAGLCAALLFAIAPGAFYYGRTFQPDTTMAFFLSCAMYAGTRFLLEDERDTWRKLATATTLLAAAILAKSVALVACIPLAALALHRYGLLGSLRRVRLWIYALGSLVPFIIYDRYETSIASWKWASGITKLHVIPSLVGAFTSPTAFYAKWQQFVDVLGMLAHTMLGPVIFTLTILAFLTPLRNRAPVMLVAWLGANLLYAYVVVTVERVDYYMYPFVPLAALVGGAYLAAAFSPERWQEASVFAKRISVAAIVLSVYVTISEARQEVAAYYQYNASVLRQARLLDAALAKHSLIVLGHLDPSVLYYIHRRGWEEDPYLWTPFNEQSAIRKGARYFIAAEPRRLEHNVELYAWLQRFPSFSAGPHSWRVYVTDPEHLVPHAEERWRAFRERESRGKLQAAHPE